MGIDLNKSGAHRIYNFKMPDFENDLILMTCASGKQSAALIPHILNKYKNIRLQCNSSASKQALSKEYPNAEVVQADLANPSDCALILADVTACWLVLPPFHPHETTLGINIIDACISQAFSGGPFAHLVYSSVLHPILQKLLNHDVKRYVEEYLIESSLNYTILQPTHMMEMLPLEKLMKEEEPVYTANWNPATKFSFVTTKDVGEVGAKMLIEREKHYAASYQLVGTPSPISYIEAAEIVGKVIGKKVKVEQRSLEDAVDVAIKGINGGKEPPKAMKEIGARMFLYYNERGLVGNSNVLGWLLGRKPTDYETWVKMKVEEIKSKKA
ncbi:NAD(P)-binding protein [Aureobasidium subglaciale]|nr:NAD(P)-binding protein [Aureobasidium subglaciale]